MSAVTPCTRATFPPVPLIGMDPLTPTGTSGSAVFVPNASPTTRYCPAASRTPVSGVVCHELPPVEAYCTDHPVRSATSSLAL